MILDHDMFDEEHGSRTDRLIGSQGYRTKRPKKAKYDPLSLDPLGLDPYGLNPIPPRDSTKDRKIPFNHVPCYDDDANYHMTDDQALLSPARARGFTLTTKCFAFLLVDKISEVTFSDLAFRSLSIDGNWKELLRNLIDGHYSDQSGHDDIIPGKGKGLIISLEGPPGCGKTLTAGQSKRFAVLYITLLTEFAESIARLMHRPLYTVSSGELSSARYFEADDTTVRAIFKRAEKWKAVVLVDEADVILTKRNMHDMFRNSLVTVFLRNLEYYEGVMFLTSNRVEAIDTAFRSRIHLRLPYSDPDVSTRTQIWKRFLPHDTGMDLCNELGRDLNVNGREIKNLARTATLLSKTGATELSANMVKTIHTLNSEQPAFGVEKAVKANIEDDY